MIIEKLAKLDRPKRRLATILAVLVITYMCYDSITRGFVVKLRASEAKHTDIQTTYAGTTKYNADFLSLQKQLEDMERQLEEQGQMCFSKKQAFLFFENINTFVLAQNLQLISRVISEPEWFVVSEEAEPLSEEAEPQQQFLKTQSANITVAGNYFDIALFLNELTDRPQRVRMTDLNIVLPPGAKFNPNASFDVAVLIYLSEEVEK